ncbi:MAG: hypothetical protein LLG04_13965 [Parachlamydia sp.]|nr:hypothetical protein [Parachlamydia sp.]
MAAPVNYNPTRPILKGVGEVILGYACGYLGARIFTSIDPVAGGIFGAAYGLIRACTQPIFARMLNEERSTSQGSSFICSVIVSAIAANFILAAATGISLTSLAALTLIISGFVASILIELAAKVAFTGISIFNEQARSPRQAVLV